MNYKTFKDQYVYADEDVLNYYVQENCPNSLVLCYKQNGSPKEIWFGKFLLEFADNKISLTSLGLTTAYNELTEVP